MAMHPRPRRVIQAALSVGSALLSMTALGLAGAYVTASAGHVVPAAPSAHDLPANAPSSSGDIVVAVVLGSSGTVTSDVLAPYDVFASSPRFSVYTVAARPGAASTEGGPAILPTYTFEDVDSGRARQPDVVVVPAVGSPKGAEEAGMRTWIRRQAARGAHVLGVCNGSSVLAETGLLDGRSATGHWSRLTALRKSHPEVRWTGGRRYVQDGRVTTTAGVTSGIPGALRVMQDLAGEDEAARVGQLMGYPGWSLDASAAIPVQSFAPSDIRVGLNALVPWFRPTIAAVLADGVDEIDVAATFEVYHQSFAARTVPVAPTGTVTTEHGMVLLTVPEREAPPVERVIAVGRGAGQRLDPRLRGWAASRHLPIEAVGGSPGSNGFDAALANLARHGGRATALSTAKLIDYPTAHLRLPEGRASVRVPVLLALGLLLVLFAGNLPGGIRRAIRRRAERQRIDSVPVTVPSVPRETDPSCR